MDELIHFKKMDVFPEIRLSDYKFIQKIGKGSFGKVYLIEHLEESSDLQQKKKKKKEIPAATF